MTDGSDRPRGAPGLLRGVDDVVFAIEQGMVTVFLLLSTVTVFLDVVYRQVSSPESKAGAFIARVLGVTDPATRTMIDSRIIPGVGLALGLGALWLAFAGAEQRSAKRLLPFRGSALVCAVAAAAALAGLVWALGNLPSKTFYLALYVLGAGGYVVWLVRAKPSGWLARTIVTAVLITPIVLWVDFWHFPDGYTWASGISLLFVLWVGLFGASVCVKTGKHIRMEALEKAAPERIRPYLGALSSLVAAAFTAFMAFLGWRYVGNAMSSSESMIPQTDLPYWVMPLAVPIAYGLTTLRFLASAISSVLGGSYGATAKAEGMEDAEKLAKAAEAPVSASAATEPALPAVAAVAPPAKKKRPIAFFVVLAAVALLPLLGKGGVLAACILAAALLAEPLFVLIGVVVVACTLLWADSTDLNAFSGLVERIMALGDNQTLLAIPFFIMAGAVMSHGEISKRLVGFARSLAGWLPGGLGISAVLACMLFAAISGSSPATVVAIGGVMAPALIKSGYKPLFAHGLVTSAGSLGILIPPSIPMVVYAIVNTTTNIKVEELFFAGYGPGIVIGGVLMGNCLWHGIVHKTPRDRFELAALGRATRDGVWSLAFPVLIFVGINSGLFTPVEAGCASVVYAIVIEVFVHRAIALRDLPRIFQETGVLLGSFMVILVVAMSFGEFLEGQQIPDLAADWITSLSLTPIQFLLVINVLLLVVGCLMDIMSAIFIFVPLLAPMAVAAGVDPLHLGIIFIVNLEIGYLTPPVGLNLFVASTLFQRPLGYMVKSVLPFIGMMLIGLGIITYVPAISIGFGAWLRGTSPPPAALPPPVGEATDADAGTTPPDDPDGGRAQTIAEMMAEMEAAQLAADRDAGAGDAGPPDAGVGVAPAVP